MLIHDPSRFWQVASYVAMGVVPLLLIAVVIVWVIGLTQAAEHDDDDDDEKSVARGVRRGESARFGTAGKGKG